MNHLEARRLQQNLKRALRLIQHQHRHGQRADVGNELVALAVGGGLLVRMDIFQQLAVLRSLIDQASNLIISRSSSLNLSSCPRFVAC
jgi:hypothetical protein